MKSSDNWYVNKIYKKHTVNKINLFVEKEEIINETKKLFKYDSINFFSNSNLEYNPKILSDLILIKENDFYNDSKRTKTKWLILILHTNIYFGCF